MHGAPFAARGAQLPLDHRERAQAALAGAFVAHAHVHQLDGLVAVREEGGFECEVALAALEDGVALAVSHAVAGGAIAATGGRERQHLSRRHVLQQVVLEGRVLHRVVRPRRDLVHAAVAGPGVAGAPFGHLEAKGGVGDHVDPRARRAAVGADLEAELAALGIEVAGGCGDIRRGGLPRQQRRAVLHRCAAVVRNRRAACLMQRRHLHFERAAVGREHHARQAGERGLFRRHHVLVAQQVEAGGVVARKAVLRLLCDARAQHLDLALQRHEVRVGFAVEHHEVAGHAAEAPPRLRAQQRVDQAHAVHRVDVDQHDGLVARDAEAPDLAQVDQPAVAHHARRGVGEDGRQVLQRQVLRGRDAQVAQPHLRQRGRHAGGALHVHGLQVAVDAGHQRLDALVGGGGEAQARGGARRDRQAHAQAGDGVQAVHLLALGRERLRVERRVGQRAVAADEGAPVGHAVDRQHVGIDRGHEVHRGHHRIAMQARLARQQQRAPCRFPARFDEQVGKGRMRLVGLGVRQHRLEVRDEFERARFVARVVQRDVAQLGVVLGADEHRGAHLQPGAGRIELHLVGQEAGAVVPVGAGRGQGGERGELGLPSVFFDIAHIEESAVAVAQRIVAPARHVERAPAAHARAVGPQRHRVAAVRQQVRGLEARPRRIDHARLEQRRQLGLAGLGRRARVGAADDLARRALVQQRLVRLHQRGAAEPAARRVVAQHVAQRHQRHALVVRHEVAHHGEVLALGLARGGEVDRVVKTELAARAERFEQLEVAHRRFGRERRGHQAGVGRHHAVGRRRAPQRQARHAEGRVLVRQRMVLREVGRLGHAPRHVLRTAEGLLLGDGRGVGHLQQAVGGLGHHERRHEVLEHRARP
ncbi:hypothetical protein D3C71_626880 [compost metagenome]